MDFEGLIAILVIAGVILGMVYFAKLILFAPPENIFAAVAEFRLKYIKNYIKQGGDINVKNSLGKTLLMIACEKSTYGVSNRAYNFQIRDLMQFLIDEGAKIDQRDKNENTELLLVSFSAERSKIILAAGADINAKNNEGMTALMKAARLGMVDNVKQLLRHGADRHMKDNSGKTVLDYAKEHGYYSVIEVLENN